MKIDPTITFWLSFAATILQGVTSGAVHLSGIVPDQAIPVVTGWIGFILFIIMSFLTLATGLSSAKPGPLAPAPTIPEATRMMEVAKQAVKEDSDKR